MYFVQKNSRNSLKAIFFQSFIDFSGRFECVLVQILFSMQFYIRMKAISFPLSGDITILCVG